MISQDFLRKLLAVECKRAGSQYQWATKCKISPAYVSDVLRGNRAIGKSILKALGMRKIVAYEYIKKGRRPS